MSSIVRATTIALAATVLSSVAQAQNGASCTKLGYVNPSALMEAAPGRAAAETLLTREGQGYQSHLQKLNDSLNKMMSDFQKAEPAMSATVKDQRQKAIQTLENDLQQKNAQFQQQFDARKNEVMAPITDVVKKVLDDIREEGCYAMIIMSEPGQSVIASADKNLDVTDKAVSRLRATKAPAVPTTKAGAPSAPAGVVRKPPTQ
ncbi:MAG TPA: OmpH family outer membrane protein [Gemmatimonadaceae bacterium]|jgi:outer membrane protein|nr:OmpH family outer membrane protein [Gemmatimonadaceae bacterium]